MKEKKEIQEVFSEDRDEIKENIQNVMLNVKSRQTVKDEEPLETNLITEGYYTKKGDAVFLYYDDNPFDAEKNSRIVLRLTENNLFMNRYGDLESRMHFEVGKRDTSIYKTPFGQFKIELLTDKIDVNLGEKEGNAEVDYSVSISGAPIIKNLLSISYRRKDV